MIVPGPLRPRAPPPPLPEREGADCACVCVMSACMRVVSLTAAALGGARKRAVSAFVCMRARWFVRVTVVQ